MNKVHTLELGKYALSGAFSQGVLVEASNNQGTTRPAVNIENDVLFSRYAAYISMSVQRILKPCYS
jgi:hypothetical protein